MMNKEMLTTLKSDKEFVEKLMSMDSVSEIQLLLQEKGVELTAEQIASVFAQTDCELDVSDLDSVAGGANNFIAWLKELFSGRKKTCTYSPLDGFVCKPKKK